tara:strand:- start:46 stop:198 length:153 start_codon:yes stop_codon:yes gene_type:complete
MNTVIFIAIMVIAVLLGRYALAEGQRIESQKKFMKNMNKFDSNKNKKHDR